MLHPDRLDGVQQQPAARIFCKVTAPGFFVVKLVFANDPHPLCLVQFFYLRTVFGDHNAGGGENRQNAICWYDSLVAVFPAAN